MFRLVTPAFRENEPRGLFVQGQPAQVSKRLSSGNTTKGVSMELGIAHTHREGALATAPIPEEEQVNSFMHDF